MAIKILPARLANQIAAGEVVERPASVVKELVENSLDSGATRIDIEIEKGGSKLIRIRDNGSGIAKDELGLALSRHATSKIHSLDDLEAIMSLGFRGEALASISSVSRLTLTSRPATQSGAWSAYAEGRDMQVKLTPAAHPVGTTLEVQDLFFNTPARRKFLRADKTEFTHIDELLKRIALSCLTVTITLKHNGKMVRQYRAAKTQAQIEKRVASVCGQNFIDHSVAVSVEHNGLKLHGWLATPEVVRNQGDLQYCYVNGRMMRDKLINHAIRQSYESALRADQYACYALFIELDPHQVDVNVHPAKHEVRFHQARLVHDFIYQALSDALSQVIELQQPQVAKSAYSQPVMNEKSATDNSRPTSSALSALPNTEITEVTSSGGYQDKVARAPSSSWSGSSDNHSTRAQYGAKSQVSEKQSAIYQSLFHTQSSASRPTALTDKDEPVLVGQDITQSSSMNTSSQSPTQKLTLGKALVVIEQQYLLLQSGQGCVLMNLQHSHYLRLLGQLTPTTGQSLKPQPLLVPLSLAVNLDQMTTAALYHELLQRLGIELQAKGKQNISVMAVPQPLRQQNLQRLIPVLLDYLSTPASQHDVASVATWLALQLTPPRVDMSLSEAINLLAELEQIWGDTLPLTLGKWIQPVDFTSTILAFNYE